MEVLISYNKYIFIEVVNLVLRIYVVNKLVFLFNWYILFYGEGKIFIFFFGFSMFESWIICIMYVLFRYICISKFGWGNYWCMLSVLYNKKKECILVDKKKYLVLFIIIYIDLVNYYINRNKYFMRM